MTPRVAVLAGVAALAAVVAVMWPLVRVPAETGMSPAAMPDFRAVTVPKAQPDKALQLLNTAKPWGTTGVAKAAEPPTPVWRMVGIVRVGDQRSIVLKAEGQPERHFQAGDTLPGGGKVVEIGEDAIIVLAGGQKRTVEIHQQGPQGL